MLSGKQKAQMLLSLLGEQAPNVLAKLSQKSATLLTSTIEDAPDSTQELMNELASEIVSKSITLKSSSEDSFSLDSVGEELNFDSDDSGGGFDLGDVGAMSEGSAFSTDDSGSMDIGFEASEVAPEETAKDQEGPQKRSPAEIADVLTQQKPQVTAFFLSRLEEEERETIEEHLPENSLQAATAIEVARLPISETVFNSMYDFILLKPEEEEEVDNAEASGMRSDGFGSEHAMDVPEMEGFGGEGSMETMSEDSTTMETTDEFISEVPENDIDLDEADQPTQTAQEVYDAYDSDNFHFEEDITEDEIGEEEIVLANAL